MRFFSASVCFVLAALLPGFALAQTTPPVTPAPAPAPAPAAPLTPRIWDFSDPKAPPLGAPYAAPGGVASNVDIAVRNGALSFTNRSGGSFGIQLSLPTFDAEQYPVVSFDYNRSSDTKVNFFFRVNGAFYGVVFSGPARVRPGSTLLGTLPGISNKGHVVIPLRDWLRRFQPRAEKLNVEQVLVGNWDNGGYLMAGIGGNGPGATWNLDNLALSDPETAAPHAGKPFFEGNDIVWPLDAGTGLKTQTATLKMDGRDFDFTSPFLSYETSFHNGSLERRVVLEAGDAGLAFKDGQTLNLSLQNATDSHGKALGDTTTSLTFKLAAHSAAAPTPRLQSDDWQAPNIDFETDLGGWAPGSAILLRDSLTPENGQFSVQFYNPRTASPFDATLPNVTVDAAKFPVLTFWYRADDRVRSDLRLTWAGKPYAIRLFDHDNPQTRLGSIENLTIDSKWHLATVPLLDWMKKANPTATDFNVTTFSFGDEAWMGNARGVSFGIDDFRFAPRRSDAIRAVVTLRDVSGVSAVSWSLDQTTDTIPDRTPEGGPALDISLAGRPAGLYWLHIRAQNGAGSWSDTANFPISVG